MTFADCSELADAIKAPPRSWTPERLWEAYEALDRSKVRGSGQRVLTDLVSLVRVALHQEDELVPYPEHVRERFSAWLLAQENAGRAFTPEQLAWLELIRDHDRRLARDHRRRLLVHAVRRGAAGSARRRRSSATTSARSSTS